MTQEKLTFPVAPVCPSLNSKHGLDLCVFRDVITPAKVLLPSLCPFLGHSQSPLKVFFTARLPWAVPRDRMGSNGQKLMHREIHQKWSRTLRLELYCEAELSTGTGCPERLWSLIPWGYSKSIWPSPEEGAQGDPAGAEAGLDDLQWSLLTWATLGVSVKGGNGDYRMHCRWEEQPPLGL